MRAAVVAFAVALATAAAAEEPASTGAIPPAPPPASRDAYVAIVRTEAVAQGLPPEVAEAVAHVESRYRPDAVGAVGEIGLMQIRPTTAAMLGHDGGALALFDPATNASYAVRYLAQAWRLAQGDLCRTLMKYRAGHGAETMSALSAEYCRRAKSYLATLGSPLADGAAPDVVAEAPVGERAAAPKARKTGPYLNWRPGKKTAEDNQRFWAAHEARIRALGARIDARRRVKLARRS